jgi:hypothetical protein
VNDVRGNSMIETSRKARRESFQIAMILPAFLLRRNPLREIAAVEANCNMLLYDSNVRQQTDRSDHGLGDGNGCRYVRPFRRRHGTLSLQAEGLKTVQS